MGNLRVEDLLLAGIGRAEEDDLLWLVQTWPANTKLLAAVSAHPKAKSKQLRGLLLEGPVESQQAFAAREDLTEEEIETLAQSASAGVRKTLLSRQTPPSAKTAAEALRGIDYAGTITLLERRDLGKETEALATAHGAALLMTRAQLSYQVGMRVKLFLEREKDSDSLEQTMDKAFELCEKYSKASKLGEKADDLAAVLISACGRTRRCTNDEEEEQLTRQRWKQALKIASMNTETRLVRNAINQEIAAGGSLRLVKLYETQLRDLEAAREKDPGETKDAITNTLEGNPCPEKAVVVRGYLADSPHYSGEAKALALAGWLEKKEPILSTPGSASPAGSIELILAQALKLVSVEAAEVAGMALAGQMFKKLTRYGALEIAHAIAGKSNYENTRLITALVKTLPEKTGYRDENLGKLEDVLPLVASGRRDKLALRDTPAIYGILRRAQKEGTSPALAEAAVEALINADSQMPVRELEQRIAETLQKPTMKKGAEPRLANTTPHTKTGERAGAKERTPA